MTIVSQTFETLNLQQILITHSSQTFKIIIFFKSKGYVILIKFYVIQCMHVFKIREENMN